MSQIPDVADPNRPDRTSEFVRLFAQHSQRIRRFIRAAVVTADAATDVFQETSVALWEHFGSFQLGTDFAAWALRIAQIRVQRYYQAQSRDRKVFSADLVEHLLVDTLELADQLEQRRRWLADCIGKLPKSDRRLLARRYTPGASSKQVADEMGRSPSYVSKALSRIHALLFDCIARHESAEGALVTHSDLSDQELLALLWDVCDGAATPARTEALAELLERQPRARRIYLQYAALLTDLAEENIVDEPPPPATPPLGVADPALPPASGLSTAPYPTLPGLIQYLRRDVTARWLLSGIGIVLIGYFAAVLGMVAWQHGRRAAAPSAPPALGTIVATQNCRWLSGPLATGDRLDAGTLRLAAGQAELLLVQGTRIVLAGPAQLELHAGHGAFLQHGQLLAHVPAQAVGFFVETPTACVVDLGTEFAVDVERTGQTDVHVLRGKVEVGKSPASGNPAAAVVVAGGQAVRVGAQDQSSIEPIAHDAQRFARLRQPPEVQPGRTALGGTAPTVAHIPRASGSHDLPAIEYLLLSNLFDDPKGVPLEAAQLSNTFRAAASADDLGVQRVALGGSPLQSIAPGCRFDFTNLGWQEMHFGDIANDAWARNDESTEGPEGGIQTLGRKIGRNEAKLEEGVGMHANALITFDLRELRGAAGADAGPDWFVCDRCGVNDFAFGNPASIHLAVLVSDERGQVQSAWVDGNPATVALAARALAISSPIGRPLTANGKFVSCRLELPESSRYLTLAVTSAGDGYLYDSGVWSGARLERVVPPRQVGR